MRMKTGQDLIPDLELLFICVHITVAVHVSKDM